jgi:hypothetical protein
MSKRKRKRFLEGDKAYALWDGLRVKGSMVLSDGLRGIYLLKVSVLRFIYPFQ